MKFKDFCLRKTYPGTFDNISTDVTVPGIYSIATNSLIEIMKNKISIFDKINVPFVEAAFECDYEKILEEKLIDGEVPDGIIHQLSIGLYGKQPTMLDEEEQAIIKVLAVYICIQN